MCNADYYRRQVIFSVLSNSSHWGKKTGQHFISITKGRREDSIEREPFCQRAMASLFGTVSRGTRINISCLQLLWVGRGNQIPAGSRRNTARQGALLLCRHVPVYLLKQNGGGEPEAAINI